MTTKQGPAQRAQRLQEQMRRGATGGIGYGARVGQTIRGALGRGAGGRFVRAADRETLRERNARLRAILAGVREYLATSRPASQATGTRRARRAQPRLNVMELLARNRQALAQRIVAEGHFSQAQATTFLAFIEGEALTDEQRADLVAAGLIDEAGNLTRAGRLLKAAYNREKIGQAKRALDMTGAQTKSALIIKAGIGDYRRAIRAAVRGYWTGEFDYEQFYEAMHTTINFHVPQAWYSGAKECGILPDELSQEERVELKRNINYELRWIEGFANAIEENSKANGGKLGPLFSRAEIWIGRYEGIRSQAKAMACKDKKLRWTLGESEHCQSCLKLAGKIKRASYWYERGILPRVHGAEYLECGGWRCQCTLEPTSEPASKGPLPSLP